MRRQLDDKHLIIAKYYLFSVALNEVTCLNIIYL